MTELINKENLKMLAEVQCTLVKIKEKVRRMNDKMEKHNHNNHKQIEIFEKIIGGKNGKKD